MATCPSCGKDIREDDWTCGSCGAPVHVGAATAGPGADSVGFAPGFDTGTARVCRPNRLRGAGRVRSAGLGPGGEGRPLAQHSHRHHPGRDRRGGHRRRLVLLRPRHGRRLPVPRHVERARRRGRQRRRHAARRRVQGDDVRHGRHRRAGRPTRSPRTSPARSSRSPSTTSSRRPATRSRRRKRRPCSSPSSRISGSCSRSRIPPTSRWRSRARRSRGRRRARPPRPRSFSSRRLARVPWRHERRSQSHQTGHARRPARGRRPAQRLRRRRGRRTRHDGR